MMLDLAHEMREAVAALTPFDRTLLGAAGIPARMIERGLIGRAGISLSGDETIWEPGIAPVYVTPCRIADPFTPECPWWRAVPEAGHLIDLVAWHPEHPQRWALRTGFAEWLGACEPQHLSDAVHVRRSPLSWLRHGGTGIVALAPEERERQRALSFALLLMAEDFEHAQELRRLMERPTSIPAIKVGIDGNGNGGTRALET